jgi:hypothetical protein
MKAHDQEETLSWLSVVELREIAQVNRTTATRWKDGISRCPWAVLQLVQLRILGNVAALLGDAWRGWRFGRDGALHAPGYTRGYAPGEILAMPFLYGQIAALKRQVRDVMRERRLDFHHAGRRCRGRALRQQG